MTEIGFQGDRSAAFRMKKPGIIPFCGPGCVDTFLEREYRLISIVSPKYEALRERETAKVAHNLRLMIGGV